MLGFLRFTGLRILGALAQAWAITTLVFFLLRLLPGDPAYLLAGANPSPTQIAAIRQSLKLNKPIWSQYSVYLTNFIRGDWGHSINTSNPVLVDLRDRFPATLELITFGILIGFLITVPWAAWSSFHPHNPLARLGSLYGKLAGAVPDFWLGILLILIFYTWLRIAPDPVGRLDLLDSPPNRVTGMYTIDAILAGQWTLAASALRHLFLPAAALSIVYCASFYRQTRVAMDRELRTNRVLFARACGLHNRQIRRQALRNSIPPVLALVGNTYGYMMGGAVLIESVFSWGGMGQYAVQGVQSSDYFAISGVVLAASLFTLLVYLFVDVLNGILDPRIRVS